MIASSPGLTNQACGAKDSLRAFLTEETLKNNLACLILGLALLSASACVLDNTDDGFLSADPGGSLGEPEASADFEPEGAADASPEPEPESDAPIHRLLLIQDETVEALGDFPGADIDAISLVKPDGAEFFLQVLGQETEVDCDNNLACDPAAMLGPPDAVDPEAGVCFGGDIPDPTLFTALNLGFVLAQFGEEGSEEGVAIENGDSIRVFEIGQTECGRFDDDSVSISISVLGGAEGELVLLGLTAPGSNVIPVSGL